MQGGYRAARKADWGDVFPFHCDPVAAKAKAAILRKEKKRESRLADEKSEMTILEVSNRDDGLDEVDGELRLFTDEEQKAIDDIMNNKR